MHASYVEAVEEWRAEGRGGAGEEFLGRRSARRRLTPPWGELPGRIGFGVRPSARRRGHAAAMPCAGLGPARERGLERALITCDSGNTASRKAIEACGGILVDRREGKSRFWA